MSLGGVALGRLGWAEGGFLPSEGQGGEGRFETCPYGSVGMVRALLGVLEMGEAWAGPVGVRLGYRVGPAFARTREGSGGGQV